MKVPPQFPSIQNEKNSYIKETQLPKTVAMIEKTRTKPFFQNAATTNSLSCLRNLPASGAENFRDLPNVPFSEHGTKKIRIVVNHKQQGSTENIGDEKILPR